MKKLHFIQIENFFAEAHWVGCGVGWVKKKFWHYGHFKWVSRLHKEMEGLYLLKGTGLKLQSVPTRQDRDSICFLLSDFLTEQKEKEISVSQGEVSLLLLK